MTREEIRQFVREATGLLEREWPIPPCWPSEDSEPSVHMSAIWSEAASRGWFSFSRDGRLAAVLAIVRATGRAACPLPVVDAFVAGRLLADRPSLIGEIGAGVVRVLVTTADVGQDGGVIRYAEAGRTATHVLVLPAEGGEARLHPIDKAEPTEGLAAPAWSDLQVGVPVAAVEADWQGADEAVVLLRLGLAARALAAAERTHEMAVGHAKKRRQFGKAIGSFGAVQQRTARCQIESTAARLLVTEASACFGTTGWQLSAELATAYVTAVASRIQLDAHHTLAASGYFEHDLAPWLFRRVHADLASLHRLTRARGNVADVLVETGAVLPPLRAGEIAERFRAALTAFLDGLAVPAWSAPGADDPGIVAAMADRDLFSMAWPPAAGGHNATLAEQFVLHEEIIYRRLPVARALAAAIAIGPPLIKYGSADQKTRFLPMIRQGTVKVCVAYSEPDAGSDLGSLRASAVRDGSQWVLNGRKLWITNAHDADYAWLAARTNPAASPPHAGISMFLVPMDTPGITTQQYRALSGDVCCGVLLNDVRVLDTARVGPVDGGWEVITEALNGERVVMAGIAASLHRQFDDLLAAVRQAPSEIGPRGSSRRAKLAELAAAVQAVRQLAAALGTAEGLSARIVAAMAGVMASELCEEFGEAVLQILGPDAALTGPFEHGLRASLGYVIGGGTNDIQRGLIARGLGLPV